MAHGEASTPGLASTDGSTVDIVQPEPGKLAVLVRDPELLNVLGEILVELKRIRLGQEIMLEQELPAEDI